MKKTRTKVPPSPDNIVSQLCFLTVDLEKLIAGPEMKTLLFITQSVWDQVAALEEIGMTKNADGTFKQFYIKITSKILIQLKLLTKIKTELEASPSPEQILLLRERVDRINTTLGNIDNDIPLPFDTHNQQLKDLE